MQAAPIKQIVAATEDPVKGNADIPEVINIFLARHLNITLNTGKLTGHLSYIEESVAPPLFGCCSTYQSLSRDNAAKSTFRLLVSDYLVSVVTKYTKEREVHAR